MVIESDRKKSKWRWIRHTLGKPLTKFNRMRHDKIIAQLTLLKIDRKRSTSIQKHPLEQTAAMRFDREISSFKKKMKRGTRPGCVLSPDLSPLYSEIIMRSVKGYPGIKVGGHNVNNLRYAMMALYSLQKTKNACNDY